MFWQLKKLRYLCISYPENNLFTLKKLIPIEDIERLPVKAIALLFFRSVDICFPHPRTLSLTLTLSLKQFSILNSPFSIN